MNIDLLQIPLLSFIIGATSAFVIIVARKIGLLDYLESRSPKWMPWGCDFCLGFWISAILAILAFIFVVKFKVIMILVPPISATINRAFLK
jgi:hypothetical protein